MQQGPIANLQPTILFRKITGLFLAIFLVIFIMDWLMYPIYLDKEVNWENVWMSAYLLAVFVTLIWQFRNVRKLITMIREGKL